MNGSNDKLKPVFDTKKGEQPIKVGSGLLAAMNKKAAEMPEEYVAYEQIETSIKNEWSMNDSSIAELAELIKDVGLLNPPILKKNKENDKYTIVAGERRYRAIGKLIEAGNWPQERKIKVHILSPEIIDLPLTDDEKEDYVRLAENAGQRGKTDGDLLLEKRGYEKIYASLREKGELSGIKTRTLLENDMKISGSKIAQFQKVENRGSDKLKEALLNDELTVSTAVKVADMSMEEQDQFIESVQEEKKEGEKIERGDILKYQNRPKGSNELKEKESKQDNVNKEEGPKESESVVIDEKIISLDRFQKDINPILQSINQKTVHLDDGQYESYLQILEGLKKLFA